MPLADTPTSPTRRWSRWRIAAVVVVLLAVAVRAALPWVARSVLESQGTALLQGRLTVGDVDLSVLRGLVTLEDVALRSDDGDADAPALVACKRLWANLGWTALVERTVELEDIGLVGLAMHVDRLADGSLVLPSVRETEPAAEPDAEVAAEPAADAGDDSSESWGVVIDHFTLADAGVQLDDYVTDPPETRRLSLPTLRFTNFRLQPSPDAEAGRGRVRLELSDGLVELRTRVRAVESGFDLAMALEVTDLPLDRVHVHLPELGWSASKGRLNGIVTARVSPSSPLVAQGSAELDGVAIEVPGESGPALAWRSLAVDVERVDLAARRASIERVALDGGRVLVQPRAPTPLPILRGASSGAASTAPAASAPAPAPAAGVPSAEPATEAQMEEPEEGAEPTAVVEQEEERLEEEEAEAEEEEEGGEASVVIGGDAESEEEESVGDGPSADEPAPEPPAARTKPAAPPADGAAPWQWSVGRLVVTNTAATVVLEPPPLEVDVRKLDVKGLSSEPGAEATVHAEVGIADGSVQIDGPILLDPVGGTLEIVAEGLDVGRLTAAAGAATPPLAARLDADLEVAAREDPLVVSGRIGLDDFETKVDEGDDFLVAWRKLAIDVERVAVSGLLPIGNENGLGPVDVHVTSVTLDEPRVVATLTPEGVVLPGAPAPAPATAPESEAPADAVAAVDTAERDAFSLLADRVTVRDGDVRFTDTTVRPAYRGRLAKLMVDAEGVRVPENRVDRITLSARVGGKAPAEVTSVRKGDDVIVTGTLRDVPLSQFNPYATKYGYRIAKGTLSLDSETTLRGDAYDSDTRLNLDRLAVTGAEGNALFKKTFGVPLSMALALLRDLSGRISLGIPVEGDERGTELAIGPIVREALTRAIVGALASPLKLLGGVRLGKGKIQAFEPAPIAFVPGTTDVAPESKPQAEQLAGALRQLPAVRVLIGGRAGANDARALAEQAVLADLEDESGVVGGMRNLLSGGTRADVRDALRERARGEPGPLEGDAAEQLDEWVAEHPVEQERLLALAAARAAALEAMLVEGGARAEQVVVGEPKARRKGGLAEVNVEVADEIVEAGDTE